MKILYIGTGDHFDVIEHFTDCNQFIFIDSRPINDYGYDYYYRPFYRPEFVGAITESLKKLGFNLEDSKILTNNFNEINMPYLESTKLKFVNKHKSDKQNRNITYYISTGIPTHLHLTDLQNDIQSCDTIIISGHGPSIQILDMLPIPHTFIGYSKTCFPDPHDLLEHKKQSAEPFDYVDAIASSNTQEHNIIKDFILVDNTTGNKKTFKNYKDFHDYYISTYFPTHI